MPDGTEEGIIPDEAQEAKQPTATPQAVEPPSPPQQYKIEGSVFGEDSEKTYKEIVDKVKGMDPESIYPPSEFPSFRGDLNGKGITSEPERERYAEPDGRVSPAEAVAMQYLLTELSTLTTSYGDDNQREVFGRLGLGKGVNAVIYVDGMHDYANLIRLAAKAREEILSGQPSTAKEGDLEANYRASLQADGMKIGPATSQVTLDSMFEEQTVKNYLSGQFDSTDTPEVRAQGEISWRKGVEHAQSFFLGISEKASAEVPDQIHPKSSEPKPPSSPEPTAQVIPESKS